MAKVVPVVAAIAGAAVTGGIGAGIFGSLAGAVTATAVNAVGSRALAKKPKVQAFTAEAQGRSLVIRSSVESHKIIYGQAKVSGPIVFGDSSSSGYDRDGNLVTGPNRFTHIVVALAGHEVAEIGSLYLNDSPVEVDAEGWVTTAPYARHGERQVTNRFDLASATAKFDPYKGLADVTFVTTAPHGFLPGQAVSVGGVVTPGFNAQTHQIGSVPTPTSFTTVAYFPSLYYAYYSGSTAPLTATGGQVWRTATVTVLESFVRVRKHLGSPDQLADSRLVAEVPAWTTDHRLRGIAYAYLRFEPDADAFPSGMPNPSFVVKGKKVHDPRNGLTYYSNDAALCQRDYLTSRDGSAVNEPYGFGCDAGEIDEPHAIAAANVCGESVPLRSGGTQVRYTCDGVVDTASAPLENLQALVTASAGAVTYVQGRFRLHAASYDAPSGVITDDMLAGGVQTTARTPRKDLFNAVKGTYVDPGRLWQPTDFPAVTNATYEAQDNGERIYRDVELPFTNDATMARRIGKLLLEKGRQGITQTLSVNHAALKHAVYDVITRTDARHGWVNKPFRIMSFGLGVPGPIAMTIREESAASYDWNFGEESTVDAAPDTDLPDPSMVQPPGALTAVESKYVTRAGDGVKAMVTLSWGASPDPFLRQYQPEYRPRAEGVWRTLNRTESTQATVEDIAPGEFDFRVKAINHRGVSSIYSTASRQVSGLLDPPIEPQDLTVSTIGGLAILRWDEYLGGANLDVRYGGKIVFRHSPDLSAGWAQSTTVGNSVPGSATQCTLPLKPGIYLAKAVDSSGVESSDFASVRTEQSTALAFANVTSLTEDPAFAGVKTDTAEIGGVLRLTGATLFSDIPLVSAVPSVALSGGVTPSGTYAFSGGIDLGAVKPVRLTSHVLAEVVNQLDTIRSRTAPMSAWKSFTGADAAEGDARVYVRTTPDDPAGTPTWGEWQRLDSGEFACRGIEAELHLENYDPAYNVLVSELSLTVDEVA